MNENKKNCPVCGEEIEVNAVTCCHCDSMLVDKTTVEKCDQKECIEDIYKGDDIAELKDAIAITTSKCFLLTIATAGLFPILFIYRKQPILNKITNCNIVTDTYIIWLATLSGFSDYFYAIDTEGIEGDFGSMLYLVLAVLMVVWSFKTKKALENYSLKKFKIDIKMNSFYTLLFTVFYIIYCINDLPDVKLKRDLLNNKN